MRVLAAQEVRWPPTYAVLVGVLALVHRRVYANISNIRGLRMEIESYHAQRAVERERTAAYLASVAGQAEVEIGLGGGSPPGGSAADETDRTAMNDLLAELTATDPDHL